MGNITYCLIDFTDPNEEFECEGKVIRAFLNTSPRFKRKKNLLLIQTNENLINRIRSYPRKLFNIMHIAAHGKYFKKTKNRLDYSVIYQTIGKTAKEIFRPESLVRLGIQADVLTLTCCESFNSYFTELLTGYKEISNFIAPKGTPLIGDTIIFSLMFYDQLVEKIRLNQKHISDTAIIKSFLLANRAYRAYKGKGDFALYNVEAKKIYE